MEAYKKLQHKYKNIEKESGKQISDFYSNFEDLFIIDNCCHNSLIVFDDCMLENQDVIKEYFVREWRTNILCIY